MNTVDLSDAILELAGPGRSWDELAEVLKVTPATAYQWLGYAEKGSFPSDKTVRGDENRRARGLLIDVARRLIDGSIGPGGARAYVARGGVPTDSAPDAVLTTSLRPKLRNMVKKIQTQIEDPTVSDSTILTTMRAWLEILSDEAA